MTSLQKSWTSISKAVPAAPALRGNSISYICFTCWKLAFWKCLMQCMTYSERWIGCAPLIPSVKHSVPLGRKASRVLRCLCPWSPCGMSKLCNLPISSWLIFSTALWILCLTLSAENNPRTEPPQIEYASSPGKSFSLSFIFCNKALNSSSVQLHKTSLWVMSEILNSLPVMFSSPCPDTRPINLTCRNGFGFWELSRIVRTPRKIALVSTGVFSPTSMMQTLQLASVRISLNILNFQSSIW